MGKEELNLRLPRFTSAVVYLTQSLEPITHEINEIDWKGGLSPEKNRLAEHSIVFIKNPT